MPQKKKRIMIAVFALITFGASVPCLAQDSSQELQQYPNDDAEAARKKEAEKLMKQSQMSVQELIKNGIIEDAKNTGDTGDYKAPTQEELQLEALGKGGNRPSAPVTPFSQDAAFSNQGGGYKSDSAFNAGGDPSRPRWSPPARAVMTQDQYQSQYMLPKDPPAARTAAPAQAQDQMPAVFNDRALPAVPVPQQKPKATNTAPANSEATAKPSDGF